MVRGDALAGREPDLPAVRRNENAYRVASEKPQPYWSKACWKYFSLKTGTAMEESKLLLRKWAWAIYLELTSMKGVSSMKLRRDLGVTQKTVWFMLHRIREAFTEVRQANWCQYRE